MTWISHLFAALILSAAATGPQAADPNPPDPETEAAQTPIIVEGSTTREAPRAQTGSRIRTDADFTELNVASATGVRGLTPGAGLEPYSGQNAVRLRMTATCVSDNEEVGERASCLMLQAREALAEDDVAGAADIFRFLASSNQFGSREQLLGGTELYNLAGSLGDDALREEALIRLLESGAMPAERRPGARRTLVDMALARNDKALAIERLEAHVAAPDPATGPDAQSLANLAILMREVGRDGAVEIMRRAIAVGRGEGRDIPQGWLDFVPAQDQAGDQTSDQIVSGAERLETPRSTLDAAASDLEIQDQEELFAITGTVLLNSQDPAQTQIGELIYRGGVEIEPGDEDIGGISGLEWFGGRLFAVSDDGRWLSITPDEIDGRLIDVLSITVDNLGDERGRRLRGKDEGDAEAIARHPQGGWLVAFEQNHRIWFYNSLSDRSNGVPDNQDVAGAVALVSDALANGGLETLAITPEALLACGEWAEVGQPNCVHASMGGSAQFELPAPLELAEHGGAPTDAACGSDGTCYVLFRSYRRGEGNRAAIMELPPEGEPTVLATLLPPLTLDNFEGLAVREQYGQTYLYLVSDNNFSDNQRTLLMKFEIRNDAPPVAVTPEPEVNYETVDVVLETTLGDITIRLETERAPVTAANFLRYIDEDRFDGTAFYRAMKLEREPRPNGLIQGGTRFDSARILPGIAHEPTTQTGLSHTNGALSMAMGEPGTANGDFSIMLADQIGLDARPDADEPVWQNGYAVFGYVIEGMDVVSAIHASETDPNLGEGMMVGQMIAEPVEIIDARRLDAPLDAAD